ncbi:MAG: ATP-binding cassette domain-containing protein [Bacillota bacterium]
MALLETHGVTKIFGDLRAVDGVSLSFDAGSVTSIIGPNGAGKTTFVNVLTGRLPLDAGRVVFRGHDISTWPPQTRVRLGIARSFQITSVFPELTVQENLAIPVLSRTGRAWRSGGWLWKDVLVAQAVWQLLDEMGLRDVATVSAAVLPSGKRRLLEIALVMASEPTLLVLDEPTAGLTAPERLELLALLRRLVRDHNKTLILVEHDMDMVFAVSDRIVVMHRGRVLADGTPETIRQNPEVREVYLGADTGEGGLDDSPSSVNATSDGGGLVIGAGRGHSPRTLLQAGDLHVYYGASHVIQGVDVTIGSGECVFLLGRNGAGKSTLMKSLSGLVPPRRGRVRFAGHDVTGWPPHRVARAGIAYVPDDRRIFGDLTVRENLQLGAQALGGRRQQWTFDRLVELFPNLGEMIDRPARKMSGGEQKMLAIARGLMGSPALLLLDEPSEGLAPKIVQGMARALRAVRVDGVSLLVADQNVRFARLVGGRGYIMEKGQVRGEGLLDELVSNQELIARYLAV